MMKLGVDERSPVWMHTDRVSDFLFRNVGLRLFLLLVRFQW